MNNKSASKKPSKNIDTSNFIDLQIDDTKISSSIIGEEIIRSIGIPNGVSVKKFKDALEVVVLNLIKNHRQNKYTAYFRQREKYKTSSRYNPRKISHSAITHVINGLHSLGFIEDKKGFYDKKDSTLNRVSRMIARQPLLDLADRYELSPEKFCKHRNFELIVLKNNKGKLIEYGATNGKAHDSSRAIAMRKKVTRINQLLQNTEIIIPSSPPRGSGSIPTTSTTLSPCDKTLYRVFNNESFVLGGRFYGGLWETEPKATRKDILINGESVVERDYKALHPTILYIHTTGNPPVSDPYTLSGFEGDPTMRSIVKLTMLVMLNAETRLAAKRAMNKKINNDAELLKIIAKKYGKLNIANLINQIENHHHAIVDHFGSNFGIALQFWDSRLAEAILIQLAEKDIACLPVHDSFIVQARHDEELISTMRSVFFDQWKHHPIID